MKRLQSFEDTRRKRSVLLKILGILLSIYFVFTFISLFLLQSVLTASNSMSPSISEGERVMIFPSAYSIANPFTGSRIKVKDAQRGEVVLIHLPSSEINKWYIRFLDSLIRFATLQQASFPNFDSRGSDVIKRVIALPGDSVMMKDYVIYIKTPDSMHFLTEFEVSGITYDLDLSRKPSGWTWNMPLSGNMEPIELGEDEYFVVSDERISSLDSRFFGPVSIKNFLGKVIWRYWPFDKMSIF